MRKPVGVLGNQGACVIAKSYEMKASGVKTGVPVWEAAKLCPSAIYVKRDFQWYEVISRKIMETVKAVSPTVEYYSIDELFFDASHLERISKGNLLEAAKGLQQRILKEIGIPVTIGIARTKLLAKLASDTIKPFGCSVYVTDEEQQALLANKPVEDITGIAKRRAKTLNGIGIHTCDQFIRADRTVIRKHITKMGEDMWWELNGVSVLPLDTQRPQHKALARGGSVGSATSDKLRAEAWLVRNVERLVDALDHHGYVCDCLGLFLGYKEGMGTYGKANLLGPTASHEFLIPAARELFEVGWKAGHHLHYMHVIAEHLQFKSSAQLSLFVQEPSPSNSELIRRVNRSIGRFKLRSASTLPLKDIYADSANDYDICDVYGKTCF